MVCQPPYHCRSHSYHPIRRSIWVFLGDSHRSDTIMPNTPEQQRNRRASKKRERVLQANLSPDLVLDGLKQLTERLKHSESKLEANLVQIGKVQAAQQHIAETLDKMETEKHTLNQILLKFI